MSKVAVIVNTSDEIGSDIVRRLGKKYPYTIYVTTSNLQKATEVVDRNSLSISKLIPACLDINKQSTIDIFAQTIAKYHGGIDILITNTTNKSIDKSKQCFDKAEQIISENFFGLQRVCKTLFPLLRDYSRVVHVSNTAGFLQNIPNSKLCVQLMNNSLEEDQLAAIMTKYLQRIKNKKASLIYGENPEIMAQCGVTSLTAIQQRVFDRMKDKIGIVVNAVDPGYVENNYKLVDRKLGFPAFKAEQTSVVPVYLALLNISSFLPKGCLVRNNRLVVKSKYYNV